jgi:hypothetical protein
MHKASSRSPYYYDVLAYRELKKGVFCIPSIFVITEQNIRTEVLNV